MCAYFANFAESPHGRKNAKAVSPSTPRNTLLTDDGIEHVNKWQDKKKHTEIR